MISLGVVALRLAVALILGSLVGWERERSERGAGIRTLALVSLGSSLIMVVSAFGFADILGKPGVTLDPSRVAAQVVSGIGFLGAGTILLRKEIVKGLTTAAAIWLVAGIGLACGAGLLAEAAITTTLALMILAGLRPLERRFFPRARIYQVMARTALSTDMAALLREVYALCGREGIEIGTLETKRNAGENGQSILITCHATQQEALLNTVALLHELPNVQGVRADVRSLQARRMERLEAYEGNNKAS